MSRCTQMIIALTLTLAALTQSGCEPTAPSAAEGEGELVMFTIDVDVEGDGSVVSAPAVIVCGVGGAICNAELEKDTLITLQARAQPGWQFKKWEGHCAAITGEVVDLVMNANLECLARFEEAEDLDGDGDDGDGMSELTLVVLGPGTVDATMTASDGSEMEMSCADATCREDVPNGTVVSLEAEPALGAELIGFSGDCAETVPGSAELDVDDDDVVCTVSFFSPDEVTYPVRVLVVGPGRVTSMPSGMNCDGETANNDCTARFPHGANVSLTATAGTGATFVEWTGPCAPADPATPPPFPLPIPATISLPPITAGVACSAVFERELTLGVVGLGSIESTDGTISCDGGCSINAPGQDLEITAVPAAGYRFVSWSGDCGSGSDVTTTLPASAQSCTATFEKIPATITVVVEGGVGGSVTTSDAEPALDCPAGACSGEVIHNPEVIDPGEWTCLIFFYGTGTGCNCGCGVPDPDCTSSGVNACQFFGDCEQASFVVEDQNHLCYVEENGGVPSVTLTASPAPGFSFSSWSGACSGASPVVTIDVPASATCTALFTPN